MTCDISQSYTYDATEFNMPSMDGIGESLHLWVLVFTCSNWRTFLTVCCDRYADLCSGGKRWQCLSHTSNNLANLWIFWIFKISLITKPGMSWAQVFSIQMPSAECIRDKEFCWDIRIQVGYLNRGHRDRASSASGFIQPPRWAAGTARWTFPLCWPNPVLPCQDCCVWCLAIGLSYIYGHLPVQTPNALSGACEIWWNYLLSFNWIPSRWLANLW